MSLREAKSLIKGEIMNKILSIAAAGIFAALLILLTYSLIKSNKGNDRVRKDDTSSVVSSVVEKEITDNNGDIVETVTEIVTSVIEEFTEDTQTEEAKTTSGQSYSVTNAPVTSRQTQAQSSTASTAKTTTGATTKATTASTTKATAGAYEYAYAGFNPQYIQITDANWKTVIVNRHYIIDKNYKPNLAHSVTGDSSSKLLDSRVAPHYNEMYLAAKADGITLTTLSGYRSYDLQHTNFENKITKYINQGYSRVKATQEAAKIILPPGTSEHNAGLAMDIISLEESFENTAAFKWLKANAADYGFILRYPKNKESITEIIYEPWHWRYVGVETAKAMNASGQCMEEYFGLA